MCKNDKNHKHCHSRNLDFDIDKNLEHAIVENGAEEHLKEHERNGKKKFDYKKFIKKRKENRKLGCNDLKFNGPLGELLLPNGFMIHVSKDGLGRIDAVVITDGKDWHYQRTSFEMFPELYDKYMKLLRAVDTVILGDVIRKVQDLTEKDLAAFRNKS